MASIRRNVRAFTLVELLVALVLVLILLAVIFPLARTGIAKAREAQCAANLRQIGNALFLYAADHNNTLPPTSLSWTTGALSNYWSYAIWPYAGYDRGAFHFPQNDISLREGAEAKNLFRCPSNWSGFIKARSTSQEVNGNRLSYGLNSTPLNPDAYIKSNTETVESYTSPIPLFRIEKRALAVMVTETSFCLGSRNGYLSWYGLTPHRGGSNFLFYDGHVTWLAFENVPKAAADPFWCGR